MRSKEDCRETRYKLMEKRKNNMKRLVYKDIRYRLYGINGCKKKTIDVTVWIKTYNQSSFIEDAINGVISQITNYEFEILIIDDASIDGTKEKVIGFAAKYPEIVRAVVLEKNIWGHPNRAAFFQHIIKTHFRGRYIALCEGDDCWVDSRKLQIQVSHMEHHPKCALYTHNGIWLDCRDLGIKVGNPFEATSPRYLKAAELIAIKNGHPPTASFLMRKEISEALWEYRDAPVGDYPLLLYALRKGRVYYNPRVMSVYRYCSVGSMSRSFKKNIGLSLRHEIGLVYFLEQFNRDTEGKYWSMVYSRLYRALDKCLGIAGKQSILRYAQKVQTHGVDIKEAYLDVCRRAMDIQVFINNPDRMPKQMKVFISKYPHIIVMGAGAYADIITECLYKNGVSFEGYVVSKKGGKKRHNKKPIWDITDIPFQKKDVGVIVGIKPVIMDEIMSILKKEIIDNWYCPFLLSDETRETRIQRVGAEQ